MGKGALGLGLEQRAGLVDVVDVDVCVELSLGDSISRIVTTMVLKMSSDGVFLVSVETSAHQHVASREAKNRFRAWACPSLGLGTAWRGDIINHRVGR